MDANRIREIKSTLSVKATNELRNIYVRNDPNEYTEEAYAAIREILKERGEAIPAQSQRVIESVVERFFTADPHRRQRVFSQNFLQGYAVR